MKKRRNITLIIDSIVTVIQAVLFAIVPLFLSSWKYQVLAFSMLVIVHIVYLIIIRKRLINRFVMSVGIDTNYIRNYKLEERFHNELIPQINEISTIEQSDRFEQYHSYLIWKMSVDFILEHFWKSEGLCNVVVSTVPDYYNNKIYANEIIIAAKKLADIYKNNDEFKTTIENLNCSTLEKEITKKYIELAKIADTT